MGEVNKNLDNPQLTRPESFWREGCVVRALVLDIEVQVSEKDDVRYVKTIRDDKLTMSASGAES
ncbi:MAG: hypothetical protein SGJ27_03310 [Candidatus Melainabacteria bacterium]|nr:hypothetical protein [Candidatus Melainabacteria bacterium]